MNKAVAIHLMLVENERKKSYFEVLLNWEMGRGIVIIYGAFYLPATKKEIILHLPSK